MTPRPVDKTERERRRREGRLIHSLIDRDGPDCRTCGQPFTTRDGDGGQDKSRWPTFSRLDRSGPVEAWNLVAVHRSCREPYTGREQRLRIIAAVAERDGPDCWICLGTIDPDLGPEHPKALTIDHVLEISLGGSHTLDNLRLAHNRCNGRRSRHLSEGHAGRARHCVVEGSAGQGESDGRRGRGTGERTIRGTLPDGQDPTGTTGCGT